MIKTVYVDMDGVLADYYKFVDPLTVNGKRPRFRELVMTHKIFANLDMMPGAVDLIATLKGLQAVRGFEIELLTSAGQYDANIFKEGAWQKAKWLSNKPVIQDWKLNVTPCGEAKAEFATSETLLIDDNVTNCINFRFNEGHAILWDATTLRQLDDSLTQLKTFFKEH